VGVGYLVPPASPPLQKGRMERTMDKKINQDLSRNPLDVLTERLTALEDANKAKDAQIAVLNQQVTERSTRIKTPELKRGRSRSTNEEVRGIARATGGASHEDFEDGTPWTPAHPEWVLESYPEEEHEVVLTLYKQAWLDGHPIQNLDQLQEIVYAFRENQEIKYPKDNSEAYAEEIVGA